MADFRRPSSSMAYDDDEILDRMMPGLPDVPDYPVGLRFTISDRVLELCDTDGDCGPGDTIRFALMGEAASVERKIDGCRIEIEIAFLALGEGTLTELDPMDRPCLCLLDTELEKLDLDDAAERGDLIHMCGEARVDATNDPRYGDRTVTLQITDLQCVEDEDAEG